MNTIEMILIHALERQYKLKRKRLAREGMQQRTKAEYQSLLSRRGHSSTSDFFRDLKNGEIPTIGIQRNYKRQTFKDNLQC